MSDPIIRVINASCETPIHCLMKTTAGSTKLMGFFSVGSVRTLIIHTWEINETRCSRRDNFSQSLLTIPVGVGEQRKLVQGMNEYFQNKFECSWVQLGALKWQIVPWVISDIEYLAGVCLHKQIGGCGGLVHHFLTAPSGITGWRTFDIHAELGFWSEKDQHTREGFPINRDPFAIQFETQNLPEGTERKMWEWLITERVGNALDNQKEINKKRFVSSSLIGIPVKSVPEPTRGSLCSALARF